MEKYGLLFETIFKRKLTDTDTVSYLENVVKEHPYFSVAQFYLLSLSEKNINGYKAQAKKTAALFNNNYWLNFQLQETGYKSSGTTTEKTALFKTLDKIYTPEEKEEIVLDAAAIQEKTEEIFVEENDPENRQEDPGFEEQELQTEIIKEEIIAVEEAKEEVYTSPVADEITLTNEDVEPAVPVQKEQTIETEEELTEPETVFTITDEVPGETIAAAENIPAPLTEMVVKNKEQLEEKEEDKTVDTNTDIVNDTVAETKTTTPATEPLLFEPLHTSDYFASVGIKLSEEEKSSDKLGKQLKSFTDWLKTMKRVHTEQLAQTSNATEVTAAITDSGIQKLAEKSNQENDVITEAMAEVLIQQGKQDKAIEILEKLSLLNPGKSAYFAAKINQIKEK